MAPHSLAWLPTPWRGFPLPGAVFRSLTRCPSLTRASFLGRCPVPWMGPVPWSEASFFGHHISSFSGACLLSVEPVDFATSTHPPRVPASSGRLARAGFPHPGPFGRARPFAQVGKPSPLSRLPRCSPSALLAFRAARLPCCSPSVLLAFRAARLPRCSPSAACRLQPAPSVSRLFRSTPLLSQARRTCPSVKRVTCVC
ncbi:hypothetical protein J3R03_009700 [Actinoplanes couchii]|nr:hypothetical protein [Actinoplanes couchii]